MSKVVKSVGRAVSKVVKGVANVAKKVVKSPIGKALVAATAIYFGGAALMGAMGAGGGAAGVAGAAAGGGLSGAAAGIGQAWSGLTGALSGGGLGSMSGVFSGGSAATGGAGMVTSMGGAGEVGAFTGATSTGLPTLATDAANVLNAGKSTGLIGSMMNSPYTAPALISGGTQLIGGVMQGYGMQKQQEEQQKLAGEERNRYNRNIGTRLWG